MPSRIATSAWPCDSPAVRKRSISVRPFYNAPPERRIRGRRTSERISFLAASHDAGDRLRHPAPRLRLAVECAAAGEGQAVVLGAAIVLGKPPFGPEQPAHFEAVQGGVEGPLFDPQDVFRRLLDPTHDGIAVH